MMEYFRCLLRTYEGTEIFKILGGGLREESEGHWSQNLDTWSWVGETGVHSDACFSGDPTEVLQGLVLD